MRAYVSETEISGAGRRAAAKSHDAYVSVANLRLCKQAGN